ncbi:ubiquitin-like protein 4A [Cuculus canorus]|uniref:ubiquitin-like protein 4A n=1 Tax=Cuculus canorus TaxID=55661 RepID=UPI0023AB2CB9|nr:ubiquitin-like protein 4A [Cuculus canorus]
MLLTVKALQGRECSLEVPPEARVGEVKRLLGERLGVPPERQRLLHRGKALADDRPLSDYALGPSPRLNLVLKPGGSGEKGGSGVLGDPPPASSPPPPPTSFFAGGALARLLTKHFGAQEGPRVLQQLQKDYEQSLRGLSLDDVERLGARLLQPEGSPPAAETPP